MIIILIYNLGSFIIIKCTILFIDKYIYLCLNYTNYGIFNENYKYIVKT